MNKICWKGRAFKALSFGQNSKKAGRNFSGSITIFHRGGGSKKLLRRIDFQRKNLAKGCIERIEYDPNRTARIALVRWSNIKLNDSMSNVQSTNPGHQIERVRALEVTIGVPRLELSSTCRRLNWRPRLLFAHGTSFLRRSFLPYSQFEQNVMYRAAVSYRIPQRFVPERTTKLAEQKVLLFADSVTNAHSHERCAVENIPYTRSASADSAQRFAQSEKVRQFRHSVHSTVAGSPAGNRIRPLTELTVPKVPTVQGTRSVRSAFSYILASDGLRCGDEILNITALPSVGSLDQAPKDSYSLMSKTGSRDENLLQPIGTILKCEPNFLTDVISSHKAVGCLHPAGSEPKPKRATQQTEPKVPQVLSSASAQRVLGVSVEPDTIRPSDHVDDLYQKSGISLPLWLVPIGSVLHNIELYPSGGGKIARAAGTSAQLVRRAELVAPVAVSSLHESLAGGPPYGSPVGWTSGEVTLAGEGGRQVLQHASYVSEQREVLQFSQNRAFESPTMDPTFQGAQQRDLLKRGTSVLRSSVSSPPTPVHRYMRGSSLCTIRLPSGQQQLLDLRCRATIGCVSNIEHRARMLTKAGQSRWLGFRPVVRGVAMNPIDHPHGGGAGRTKGGRPSVSPWGKPAKRARRYR